MTVGLGISILLARYLGPENFGILNLSLSFVLVFGIFAGLGLRNILIQQIIEKPSAVDHLLGSAVFLQAISGILAYVLILIVARSLYSDGLLLWTISVVGMLPLLKVREIPMYWFEAKVESKAIVLTELVILMGSAVLKLILIKYSANLIYFAWVLVIEAFLLLIFHFKILNASGLPLRHIKCSPQYLSLLLFRSWPLLLSTSAMVLNSKLDQLMVGHLMGNFYVGLYSAASRLSDVWYFFPAAVVASIFPTIIGLKQKDQKEYDRRIAGLYSILITITITFSLMISIFGDFLVVSLYGKVYSHASEVLVIHAWTSVFVAMSHVNQRWLINENLEKYSFIFLSVGVVLNIILSYLLIPVFGMKGAAFGTLGAWAISTVMVPLLYRDGRRMYKNCWPFFH